MRVLKAFFEVRQIKLSPDALRMWIDALSDLKPEALVDAIRRFNRESTEYPTPAAVRRYAGAVAASIEDRARVAWSAVLREIRSSGYYESVEFDDRIINATIRAMGGWEKMCDVTTDVLPFREKDFIANYLSICRTGVGNGSPLIGHVARANLPNGYAAPKPKRITTGLSPHPLAGNLEYVDEKPKHRLRQVNELAKQFRIEKD